MVFKLVRTDTEEPCKIQLPLGVHLIGRGKFLDCDDKRVSRKHGQVEVTEDTFSIKALHHNPCFYIKKGASETQILKQDCSVTLTNGDKFGLLPDTCWYELLHCSLEITNEDNTQILDETQTLNDNEMTLQTEPEPEDQDTSADEELNFQLNESNTQRSESPSLIQGTEAVGAGGAPGSPSFTQQNPVPSNDGEETSTSIVTSTTNPVEDNQPSEENGSKESPPKRCHSPESSDEAVKKVKVEPEDVKPQLPVKDEPGSSNATPGPSGDSGTNNNNGQANPASPAKPAAAPPRERCMYGANCYRKNPAHKAQFAHPSDADWGAGARGVCPYGASCGKRDPRHWRDHDHPPGVMPPLPYQPGMRMVQRHGNVFYINAHSVHFHDDHVEVEDSDGESESVDFDYEF